MGDKIKKLLKFITESEILILVIGIILFFKTIFFYKNTIALVEELKYSTIFGTMIFIFIIMLLISVLPKKIRTKSAILVDILISVMLYADNLYYIFSNSVLSVAQITNLQYAEQISDTLPKLVQINHILYFIDIILLFVMFIFKVIKIDELGKKEKQRETKKELKTKQEQKIEKETEKTKIKISKFRKIQIITTVVIATLLFVTFGIGFIKKGTENSYNKDLQLSEATIYGYHISDIINVLNYKRNTKYKNYDEMIKKYESIKEDYRNEYNQTDESVKGILKDRNVIILQLESIQEFVVNKKINGKEITPNLNKFLSENINFTNMHMQSYSTTADSEYTTVTSTYPMENGMSFSRYYTNSYDDIFKMFKENNYNTSYMHGNFKEFWNRGNVYSRMQIDNLVFKDNFDDLSENINGDLSDELFYRQAVQKLQSYEKPFFTYMVSASSHTPYTLSGIQDKERKVNIDVGEYKETYFGDYLEAVNYADYAFGIFIEELKKSNLYEDTAILIFGDHNGLTMYDEELLKFLKDDNPDLTDIDIKLDYTRVLCGLKLPEVSESKTIDKVVNKLDVKPTFAYLCDIEDGFSLGTNMFDNKDFVCLNNERIITNEYYYDEQWYNIKTGEVLNLEELSQETREKLDEYYRFMKDELNISFSININNLLNNIKLV